MQYMHSYFQILKFPLIVIAFACFLCGVSNIILHPAYGLVTIIANDGVFLVGELLGISSCRFNWLFCIPHCYDVCASTSITILCV